MRTITTPLTDAQRDLAERHADLARIAARRHVRNDSRIALPEAISAAYDGLIAAARRYRGRVPFPAFAWTCMCFSIRRAAQQQGVIRAPLSQCENRTASYAIYGDEADRASRTVYLSALPPEIEEFAAPAPGGVGWDEAPAWALLDGLSERERRVAWERWVLDQTVSGIARGLGADRRSVQASLRRARAKLRDRLGDAERRGSCR